MAVGLARPATTCVSVNPAGTVAAAARFVRNRNEAHHESARLQEHSVIG
jgi:hypothetical protein